MMDICTRCKVYRVVYSSQPGVGAGAGAGRGVTVREGARVVLQCSAHSNPPPFNYHWRQDGHNRNHSQMTFRFQNSLHTYLVYGKSGMTSRFKNI